MISHLLNLKNMRKYFILSLIAITLFLSCEKDDATKSYYVKYVATSLAPTNELHDVILYVPGEKKPTRLFCQDAFEEVYGPYKSGTKIEFGVDEPNMDTFLVKLYVREKSSNHYNLVREEYNQIDYVLP